ncbi:MAG: alpha/beta hydrolase [Pseudomonadota bacterium]|nr:alpha/beta hydrolase [Pseudomonadota bacterium]
MTKYKFDKQIKERLDLVNELGIKYEEMSANEARQIPWTAGSKDESPEVGSVVEIGADGPFGPIKMYHYLPKGASYEDKLPAIIYYHGGGWVIGSRNGHDILCRHLSNTSGCRVFSVEYRLAPDFKFPVPVEDSYAAIKFIKENHDHLNVDPEKLIVAGDSAGGNLAAVMSLMAREDNALDINYQILIYTVIEGSKEFKSYEENAEGYILTRNLMRWFYEHYLTNDKEREDWRVSPIQAKDLSNLPPAYIITVLSDPLRDEGREYAKALKEAGNSVEHIEYDNAVHGFISWPLEIKLTKKAIEDISKSIRKIIK